MRGIHMMLHNALDRAVKEKRILSNPTENCIIPKIEKQEMKILHPDHISACGAAEQRGARSPCLSGDWSVDCER